jgi:NADH-quinone oxidoreductase subunit G
VPEGFVQATIDGFQVAVPKGTLVIRAAELVGIQIPRFCDHPLLDPVGACRSAWSRWRASASRSPPAPAPVTDGMVVKTQLTSPIAEKAQRGNLEFLLINHPLDCPVCDKGGECPLQNQTMSNGPGETRFNDVKRTYPKPIAISSQVLLDRERCVLCARCTRFSQQVAGDPFIELFERGALQQVAIYTDQPFESYFSGNTVQICPVGALTGAAYRFRARPFDLVSTPMVCEHCASAARCAPTTAAARCCAGWPVTTRRSTRSGTATRAAGPSPTPSRATGSPARWCATTTAAAPAGQLDRGARPRRRGLRLARGEGGVGVLPGGRLTVEDAYAYSKFARWCSAPTTSTPACARTPRGAGLPRRARRRAATAGQDGVVTYADLEQAPAVLARRLRAGGGVADRLPAAAQGRPPARHPGLHHRAVPLPGRGRRPPPGCCRRPPGPRRLALDRLLGADRRGHRGRGRSGHCPRPGLGDPGRGSGSRARPARCPPSARLATATGARLAWIPRAGQVSAARIDVGRAARAAARRPAPTPTPRDVAAVWGELPAGAGRDLTGILTAARDGELSGPGRRRRRPGRLPRPVAGARRARPVPFLVSLELRRSPVTDRADVVLPVAAAWRRPGTFLDWEGRARPFERVLRAGRRADRRPGAARARRRDGRPLGPARTSPPRAPRSPASGACPTAPPRRRAAPRRPRRRPARRCWPPGTGCSTTAPCRTASRSWPAPPSGRGCTCPPATAAEIGATQGALVTVSSDGAA